MKPHAHLLVLLFALHAQAATINAPTSSEIEKKLPIVPQDPNNESAENVFPEQEDIDSTNIIKDIENNLRVKQPDSIPVTVIVDNPDDDDTDIKRVEVDLRHPGEPQRQEHETQNPEHYENEQMVMSSIKQTVINSDAALRQDFQGVAQGIQNWFSNNEQFASIQESIQNLQQSFQNQISKLNGTIQSYWQNQVVGNVQQDENREPVLVNVEQNLKTLDDNFQIGVKALSEGVQVFAALRQDTDKPTSPAPPNNIFAQYLQLFQQTISQGFNNVTQAIQNYVTPGNNNATGDKPSSGGFLQGWGGIQNILNQGGSNPPTGAQSDDPSAPKPTIWQGIQSSLQTILNPGQTQSNQPGSQPGVVPNRPLAQAIQNNPFVQGVVNLIQPNRPEIQQPAAVQPEKPAEPAAQASQENSNVVQKETENKPEAVNEPAKASEPAPVNGPIRNIIQNNPIVKGISGAVQKLQSSINPEKPRDAVNEQMKEVSEGAKGHGGSGNNNDDSGIVKSEPEKAVDVSAIVMKLPEKVESEKAQEETKKTDHTVVA